MPTASQPPKPWLLWAGRILSALPVLVMGFAAAFAFTRSPQVVEGMSKFGYPESALLTIGVLELVSVVVYVIPRTAVLGAILMTGYLGGAVATHVRVGDPGWPTAVVLGIFVWGGLYLRDERIRALLPLRQPQ
jgi:hypothetical protein